MSQNQAADLCVTLKWANFVTLIKLRPPSYLDPKEFSKIIVNP